MNEQEIIWSYIKQLLGTPYSWGGDNPERGFDCSGFVVELLKSTGFVENRFDATAHGLRTMMKKQGHKSVKKAVFGDIVFYGHGERSTHVAFCLNDKQMVEAGGGGSRTVTRADAARQAAFIRIRPIYYRKDVQEIIRCPLT